jgi:hypothetical protein
MQAVTHQPTNNPATRNNAALLRCYQNRGVNPACREARAGNHGQYHLSYLLLVYILAEFQRCSMNNR